MGLGFDEMRNMTPRAITLYVEAVNEHHFELYREKVSIAHLTATLSRLPSSKEGNRAFPKLADLLRRVASKKKKKEPPVSRRKDMIAYFNSLPHTKKQLKIVKDGKVKK